MTRPSTIDALDTKIQAEIGRLRMQGCTIDEIVAHLGKMHGATVSRSALGRHVKGLERVAEQIRRSREVATALVQQLGDAPESETARLNIEIMHSAILDLKMRSADGERVDAGGAAALAGNPEGSCCVQGDRPPGEGAEVEPGFRRASGKAGRGPDEAGGGRRG